MAAALPIPNDGYTPLEEIVNLAAVDSEFYARHFFQRTVRQKSPKMHAEIWHLLENPLARYVNILVYRDGAKTTLCRLFSSKRVAYALSNTILYISKSEGHGVRSLDWLRRNVEYNKRWSDTYQITKGVKWGGAEIEIVNKAIGEPIWIMAMGITGSVRGVNRDDFRPDLIILDDVLDKENSATPEQRKKISELVHGDVKDSLAPESERPDAVLIALNTPQHREDFANVALKDPEWYSARHSCWTPETEGLNVDEQVSSWPERYPTELMQQRKRTAIVMNRYSIFAREKECRIVSSETTSFKIEHLQTYDLMPPRNELVVVMWIDPVPPPTEVQIAQGFAKKDYEAFAVVGQHMPTGNFYVLEMRSNRGHAPDWTVATFFELITRWLPRKVLVETVAYQKTLEWILRRAMDEKRQWVAIEGRDDRRNKYDKILDGLTGPITSRRVFLRAEQTVLRAQLEEYPDCPHDDEIEAAAQAVAELHGQGVVLEGDFLNVTDQQPSLPVMQAWRSAP